MKKYLNSLLFVLIIFSSCHKKSTDITDIRKGTSVNNIYRYYIEDRGGFKIWIVDGPVIRREIFPEFVYGGNSERYTFIPEDEIWIDNSITSEELETTIEHEINERNLMNRYGMTYFDAHDSSLSVELKMRKDFMQIVKVHEQSLPPVMPIDFDSVKEIPSVSDKIRLKNIYRQYYKKTDNLNIWIVDGFIIRRDIYPDFGFSGNYLAYKFIPENEIWIDAQVSCEELMYSIELEKNESSEMKKGKVYDAAYETALSEILKLRQNNFNNVSNISPVRAIPPLYRDTGTGKINMH